MKVDRSNSHNFNASDASLHPKARSAVVAIRAAFADNNNLNLTGIPATDMQLSTILSIPQ